MECLEEVREWRAAASKAQCDVIEADLHSQGLDVTLVDREIAGDDLLKVACIFDSPDSEKVAEMAVA